MDINNPKPKLTVEDVKPSIDSSSQSKELQLFNVTLGRGMATGVVGMTYPEDINIVSTKTI